MKRKNSPRSLRCVVYLSCLALTLWESPLNAAVLIKAETFASLGSAPNPPGATSGEVTADRSGANSDASDHARARARFGVLNAYAEGRMANRGPNNISSVFATGNATFTEDITINAPGRAGQSGLLTFTVNIHGSLASALRGAGVEDPSTVRSYARARFMVSTTTQTIRDDIERRNADGTMTITGLPFLNRLETIVVPFTYGTTFELRIFIQAATNSRSEFGADCISDVGNTLEWGGIVSVTDSGGNAVTNHTTATGSGTDYSAPILDLPRLTLAVLNPAQLQLSWSTNYPVYTLESSAVLPSGWQTVTNNIGLAGEQYTLTFDAPMARQFFRLRKN